ncbi:MAG: ABC transporter ATP-binding protein, partial [Candidatus Methanoplasma sp.]|nr:ABC transporter ATP-binding protein [Candidatus Methanoplasma sp.]
MRIRVKDMGFGYTQSVPILKNIDLDISGNKLVSIIGPNGVGKSTFIHCINKILKPTSGTVEVNDRDVEGYTLKELSKIIGYVPCSSSDTFPLSVVDAVLLGRSPHSKWGSLDEDLAKVHKVLQLLDIEELAMRPFNEISAGQHQKV